MGTRRVGLAVAVAILVGALVGCGGGGGGGGSSAPAPSLASVTPSTLEGLVGAWLTLSGKNLGVSGDEATLRLRATSGTPFLNGTSATLDFHAALDSSLVAHVVVPGLCVGWPVVADLVFIRTDGATATLRNGLSFEPQTKVTDRDGDAISGLGTSVACFEQWTVAGEPLDREDGFESGAAFFHDAATGLVQRVVPTDGLTAAHFGCSVDITGDVAVIGAEGAGGTGAAYVFMRLGSGATPWLQVQKLTASDGWLGDEFGRAVSIDTDVIAVGAPLADRGTSDRAGAVYVFHFNGMAWTQNRKLGASDRWDGDEFGSSVDITPDRVLVGAPKANIDLIFVDAGAVYVFDREGATWPPTESVKLEAARPEYGDRFGAAVSLNGSWLFAGAPGDDVQGTDAGAVHVFQLSNTVWADVDKLLAPGGSAGDAFGSALTMRAFWGVIGSPGSDARAPEAGAAHMLTLNEGVWTFDALLCAGTPGSGDAFGSSVSFHDVVAVGAPGDDAVASDAGAIYIYDR